MTEVIGFKLTPEAVFRPDHVKRVVDSMVSKGQLEQADRLVVIYIDGSQDKRLANPIDWVTCEVYHSFTPDKDFRTILKGCMQKVAERMVGR